MASSFSDTRVAQPRLAESGVAPSRVAQSRVALALSAVVMLGACSGSDRLPPTEISGVPKGTRSERVLEGRVRDVDMAQRRGGYEEPIAYAAPTSNGNGGSAGIDYLDTPNLAGTGARSGAPQAMQPIEASGENGSRAMASVSPDEMGTGGLIIPEGGVNIDAELGISAADSEGYSSPQQVVGVQPQIVTSGGAMAIAEGNTSQPVVDGIGFDNPTSLNGDQPQSDIADIPAAVPPVADDGILPLAEDSGNSGMADAVSKPSVDCSLYLDKRNCPRG